MKTKLGERTIKKKDILYPSPRNPRLEALTTKDASIQALAKSIKSNGLQYNPILLALPKGKYEAIDGDRRLVAIFDILKWKEVTATVWKIDTDLELFYLKLASNWDRIDFSGIEKGRYLYNIAEEEVKKDGLIIDEVWTQRTLRQEYIRRIADNLAKSKSMVSRNIGLWLLIPRADRHRIARNREDLLKGKLSPTKAMQIASSGRKLGDVETVWRAFVPKEGPIDVSHKELRLLKKKISLGQITTVDQVVEFRKNKNVDQWKDLPLMITRDEEVMSSKLAAKFETSLPKIVRACIHLGFSNTEALAKILPTIGD